jgi:hypothetical protein
MTRLGHHRFLNGGVQMKTLYNCQSAVRTVGLEELESRIVFDGAIDQTPHNDVSATDAFASAVTDSHESARLTSPSGTETLSNGTVHYWHDYNSGQLEEHYDAYWYTNGSISWDYQGSYWEANGNGWEYSGDSSGFWEFTGVQFDSSGNGYEYWGDCLQHWTYHGVSFNGENGWEYIGDSNGAWYYHTVGPDGSGEYNFEGNYTGYWSYTYTWANGWSQTYGSQTGVGDPNWYVDPDVTSPVSGEWFASSEHPGYYEYDFPESYYDDTTGTVVPVYIAYTADFETYYYYFPAVYYSNYGDAGFALHPVNGIGGEPGVNETWDPNCPIYDTHATFDQWYYAGAGDYMPGWWTYNDSDSHYSLFTQDFETYDYYFVGFWYSSADGYEFHMESQSYNWSLPNVGSNSSDFVPTADHLRVGVVDSGSHWNDATFHYADPVYNSDDDYWAFTVLDNANNVLLRYYVENPSDHFDPWAVVHGTDTSHLDVYVGMYYDESGTYWGMEQDYLQEDVRAIWYDLPDFNVHSWSYYTQLLAHAENTTIDQMVYSGHGNVNNFWVGDEDITSSNITNYATDLQGIGSVMSNGAQLQLWECLIAGNLSTDGQKAINARHMLAELASYTDSTVFASDESTWMIHEDNHIADNTSAYTSDWTMEFGVNPSGTQVVYTTLVYYVYDNSTWDPDWRDVSPYGETPNAGTPNWLHV